MAIGKQVSNGVETILRADVSENNVSMSLTYNLVSPISTSKADVQLFNPAPQTISTSMYSQPVFSSTCKDLDAQKQSTFTETAIEEPCQMIESYDLSQKSKCISTQETYERSFSGEQNSEQVTCKTGADFSHQRTNEPAVQVLRSARIIDAIPSVPVVQQGTVCSLVYKALI